MNGLRAKKKARERLAVNGKQGSLIREGKKRASGGWDISLRNGGKEIRWTD